MLQYSVPARFSARKYVPAKMKEGQFFAWLLPAVTIKHQPVRFLVATVYLVALILAPDEEKNVRRAEFPSPGKT